MYETGRGPLTGTRVIEFGQALAVPMCTLLLADMGAEVIKVEPRIGEGFRHGQGEIVPAESKGFIPLNRGKRSICIDLAAPGAKDVLESLVRWADVAVVGTKPSDHARYGIGYDDFKALNEQIVYLEHAPLGHKGPYGGEGGYDVIVQGMSGLATVTGRSVNGEVPENVRPAYIDMGTAFLSALGVVTAILHRERTGKGQRVETSLLSTAYGLGSVTLSWFAATDPPVWESFHEKLLALRAEGANFETQRRLYADTILAGSRGNIYFRHYRTADGLISVGCLSPVLNRRFREATGISDPRTDRSFEPGTSEGRAAIDAMVSSAEATLRSRTSREWLNHFKAAGVPAGPFNFPTEAMFDEQAVANDFVREYDHPLVGRYRSFGSIVRMDESPVGPRGPAPTLGQHTDEVLGELGFSADHIAALHASNTIGPEYLHG